MPFSYNEVGTKAAGDTISIPFPYINEDHIFIKVDGVTVSSTLYEFSTTSTLLCLSGFPEGDVTRVERITPPDELPAAQQGTGVFDWKGANKNDEHLLYIAQERADVEEAVLNGAAQVAEDLVIVSAAAAAASAAAGGVADDAASASAAAGTATTKASEASASAASAAASALLAASFDPDAYVKLAAQALDSGVQEQVALNLGLGVNYNRWKTHNLYTPSAALALEITDLDDYEALRLQGFLTPSAAAQLLYRVSADAGSNWLQGASDYIRSYSGHDNGGGANSSTTSSSGILSYPSMGSSTPTHLNEMLFSGWAYAGQGGMSGNMAGGSSGGSNIGLTIFNRHVSGAAVALNGLQIYAASGTITGELYLEVRQ